MSNFGLSCDVCNRENVGITWVNGMKFCAKCYQETFGNLLVFTNETGKFVNLLNTETYELKISNLERNLEEKDQRIAELEEFLHNREKWLVELEKQVNFSRAMERVALKGCKELEEQLKNAIVPKFKVGDKVYAIIDTFAYTDVLPVEIRDTHLLYEVWDGQDTTKQHYTRIFATKEEAQAKLEELQGEKK